jgi:hypothetical protein
MKLSSGPIATIHVAYQIINSVAILADDSNSVQMEFLVATAVNQACA